MLFGKLGLALAENTDRDWEPWVFFIEGGHSWFAI